jgi:hypothetical protein
MKLMGRRSLRACQFRSRGQSGTASRVIYASNWYIALALQGGAFIIRAATPPHLSAAHPRMDFCAPPSEHLRRQRLQIVDQAPFAEILKGIIGLKRSRTGGTPRSCLPRPEDGPRNEVVPP